MRNNIKRRLRSLKVGQKLVLIYILGIFLPLLLTNGVILRGVLLDARKHEEEFMLSTLDNIMQQIEREFEPIEDVTEFLYSDPSIYRLLAQEYDRFSDFLTIYTNYLLPAVMKYMNVFQGIDKIVIYTENSIVDVAGVYMGINNYIRRTIWYRKLPFRETGLITMVQLDEDVRMDIKPKSYISVFRHLNNPAVSRPGRLILRIDVRRSVIQRYMLSRDFDSYFQLIDPNGVVAVENGVKREGPANFSFGRDFRDNKFLDGWHLNGNFYGKMQADDWQLPWTMLFIISGFSIALTSLFILYLSQSITSRLATLSAQMRKVKHEDFSQIQRTADIQDEVGQLIDDYNIMAEKIDELINHGYKMQIERGRLLLAQRQAELAAVQSQVNPHFLYNVLESIRMKSHIKGEHETALIIKKLSRNYRRITSWNDDLIPLENELNFTREYLEIQQYRFENRLKTDFRIQGEIRDLMIPKLTIQALVENACAHGMEANADGGTVTVWVICNENMYEITVADDGAGCDVERIRKAIFKNQSDGSHIGLANVYRRLQLHFGERVDFHFESEIGRGTQITIRIRNGIA